MANKKRKLRPKGHIKRVSKQPQRELAKKQDLYIDSQSEKDRLLRRRPHKPFNEKLNEIQDFRFDRYEPRIHREIQGRAATILPHTKRPNKPLYKFRYTYMPWSDSFKFKSPNKTVTCWRRKIRRAVIFAKGLQGKGAKQKVRKTTPGSLIVCTHRRRR